MASRYYQILGVDEKASLGAIKKAYRSKAKILHPDVNKAADAHDQFVLLNEAYEYLENVKTGKIFHSSSTRKKRKPQKKATRSQTFANEEDWKNAQREKARRRAKAYAKMKFEEFQKTEAYQTTNALGLLMGLVIDVFIVAMAICIISICLYFFSGIVGMLLGLGILASSGIHKNSTYTSVNNNFKNAKAALELLSDTKIPLILSLAFLNIILMWTITLQSLWIFSHLFFFYILLANMVVFLFWPTEKPEKQNEALWMIGYIPGAINLFFFLNFVFSSNPSLESHKYKHGGWLIELDDDAYYEYRWLRLYPTFTEADDNNRVQFEFEEGLFGYRVLKDAQFHPY
jgi:curved DNA-binding protein CbpA